MKAVDELLHPGPVFIRVPNQVQGVIRSAPPIIYALCPRSRHGSDVNLQSLSPHTHTLSQSPRNLHHVSALYCGTVTHTAQKFGKDVKINARVHGAADQGWSLTQHVWLSTQSDSC